MGGVAKYIYITKLGFEKYFCNVRYLTPLEMLSEQTYSRWS